MAVPRRRFLVALGAVLVPGPALAAPRYGRDRPRARDRLVLAYRSRRSPGLGDGFEVIRRMIVDGPALVLAALAPYDLAVEPLDEREGRGWASLAGEDVIARREGGVRPRLLAGRLSEAPRLRAAAARLEAAHPEVGANAARALHGEELDDDALLDASAAIALLGAGSPEGRRALQRVGEAMRRHVREQPPDGTLWTRHRVESSCIGDFETPDFPEERLVAEGEHTVINCGMARLDGRAREFLARVTRGRPA